MKSKRYHWYLIQVTQGSQADLALQQQIVNNQEQKTTRNSGFLAYWRMAAGCRDQAIGQLLLGLFVASFVKEAE